ncbi:MAG: hypothetical protein M9951_16925 [Burkholderiaceae bacterium]|nr:hypothetical protein [Burkholderiaceae bacterium]
MTSWPFPDRTPDGITVEADIAYDTYTGSVDALIAAGIIERSQLPPQVGRMPGNAAFFPDGSPVPYGCTGMPREAGYRWIEVLRDGKAEVKVYVSQEERRVRRRDSPLYEFTFDGCDGSRREHYSGNREQLVARGLPAEWMDETRKKEGKRWTKRTIQEPGRKIEIFFTPDDRFRIEIRKDALQRPAPAALPDREAGHQHPNLRLVWSV